MSPSELLSCAIRHLPLTVLELMASCHLFRADTCGVHFPFVCLPPNPVHSAAERHWREAGATSARAAVSVYTAIYRRRWGCETALQGARLRLSRAYLAAGGDARRARGAAHPTFDPGDADHFAAAASPVLRGLPAGQRD